MLKMKKQFKIIIEQDEDGFFVASVPALPGCYTQAETLSELNKRIKEAILLCLEVAKEDSDYREKIKYLSYEPIFVGLQSITI